MGERSQEMRTEILSARYCRRIILDYWQHRNFPVVTSLGIVPPPTSLMNHVLMLSAVKWRHAADYTGSIRSVGQSFQSEHLKDVWIEAASSVSFPNSGVEKSNSAAKLGNETRHP